jgi:hypothetical protein
VSIKASLVLAVLFIVLGTFAIFDPFGHKAKREEIKERDAAVFWLKDKKLSWLQIKRGPLDPMRLVCKNAAGCPLDSSGEWTIEAPITELADNNNVGSFLTTLDNLSPVDQLDYAKQAPDLLEFGLKTPAFELRFQEVGKPESWLNIGGKTSVGSNYYAQSSGSGQNILMIASYFFDAMNKEIVHWRNKRVFPSARTEDISSLAWSDFSFEQKDGLWSITKPIKAKANSTILNGLSGSIAFLSAQSIVAENNKTIALGKSSLSINATFGAKTESLVFFEQKEKDKNKLLLKSSTQAWIADVEATLLSRFNRKLSDFRNKQLITLEERKRIISAEFYFPRQKLRAIFKRGQQNEWAQTGGEPVKLSQQRINQFLEKLDQNQVTSFERDKTKSAYFLNIKDLELKLLDKDDKLIASLPFSIFNKKEALTVGELPGELRALTGEFLQILPIRLTDLDIDNNKQIVTSARPDSPTEEILDEEAEGDGHGHSHSAD